jgi:putative membrane protein
VGWSPTVIGAATWTGLLPLVQERGWEWGWGWHPMWGAMWPIGIAVMFTVLLFWLLVLVGFFLGLRWLIGQGRASRPDPALDILRQRYARGEIDKNEFETKKRDLI